MSVKQYDRFIPLFSDDLTDRRSTLFLSELKHAADKARISRSGADYNASDLKISDATSASIIAKYFLDQEGKKDTDVHPAWVRFAGAVGVARAGNTTARGVLDIIKSLANPKSGSLDQLVQGLLQSHLLAELKDKTSDIT